MSKSLSLVRIATALLLAAASSVTAQTPRIGSGHDHTVMVRADGTLWAWGDNDYGQLGDGTTNDRLLPVRIGADSTWIAASAGYWHSIGLKADGTLWAWGRNDSGQVGDGSTNNRLSPVQVGAGSRWVSISAGFSHNMALRADGTLWAWGWNSFGVLGDGTRTVRLLPVQIGPEKRWAEIAGGGFHSLGLATDGTLWAWGRNDFGELGDGTTNHSNWPVQVGSDNDWKQVAGGGYHSLGIKSDGTLWTWGKNEYGQLGDGSTDDSSVPIQIGSQRWSAVSGGGYYSLCIRADGSVWTWGENGWGQIGDNSFTERHLPTQIGSDRRWVAVAAHDHSVALQADGTLWAWGANRGGQLGNGQLQSGVVPAFVIPSSTPDSWASVSGGIYYSVALKSNGTLWAWGYNEFAQLGNGTTTDQPSPSPAQIGSDNDWVAVSGGYAFGLALKANGTLWGWGDNGNGQVGDGTTIRKLSPVQIGTDNDWAAISAGALYHSLAIKANGTLWAWGRNESGQLGDGTLVNKSAPVQIGTANDWVAVSAGGAHSLALKSNGTLWAWGYNGQGAPHFGMLGDGTTVNRSSPVRIGSDNTWREISAGYIHSTGRKSDGTIWVWGGNHQGELGLGGFTSVTIPTQVGVGDTWRTISAKNDTTHAIGSDGALWGWGDSTFGQVGDGTNARSLFPLQIGTGHAWVSLGRAFYHGLALKADGTMWAWGRNQYGQLGDGTVFDQNSPAQVTPPAGEVLLVMPLDGLSSSGQYGGPFSPSSKVYTLTNNGDNAITWSATSGQAWISLSQTSGTLDPGSSTAVTVSVGSSASSLAPGEYTDTVTFANTTSGSGTTARAATLTIAASDLIVSTLTGPTSSVTPGQVVTLTDTTRNQGTAATTVSTVTRFYWSANSAYDAGDVPLAERVIGPLGAGTSDGPQNTTVTIPSTATAGTYYLIARADANGMVAETSESNNTRAISVLVGADLVVPTLTGPATPVSPGQVITVSETTRNQGTVAAPVSSVTRFYWSTNSVYDAADLPLAERTVGPLGAGASDGPVNTTITVPASATAGAYYLIARADADGTVTETSETNNTRSTSIGIGADLIVPTLTVPSSSVAPGQAITLTDTTRNQGTAATTVSTVTRFYWSTNSTFDAADVTLAQRTVGPLAAGATDGPTNTTVTIPATATAGTYYLIARADADGTVTETTETNNTRSTSVAIGADLIVPTLTAPMTPVAPGQAITLSETTRNQGTGATAVNTVTRVYWSTNSTYDAADVPLAQRTIAPLAAGASNGPVNVTVTIPSTATSGTYYLIASADADGAVAETLETNNTRSTSVMVGADLIVPTLTVPTATVTPGQVITLSETTQNQGTVATTVSTATRFYWSTNSTWEAADVPLAVRTVGPLAAGASNGPVPTTVTIPATATAGTYYLIARADADGAAAETSETNNTRFSSVAVGADLIVQTLTGPTAPVTPGQVITLPETTRNQGTVASPVSTVTRLYWSTDSVYDAADVPLAERVVGPLGAGISNGPVNITVTIPSTAAAGTYYVIARADADGAVPETSETNNTRATSIGIGADLVVQTLTGPSTPVTPGQVITVTDTTRNQGTAAATSSTVTRFYWSTNSVYDAADLPLDERVVGPLGAGTTSAQATTPLTIPATAAAGTYYVIALADANATVTETSETNNTRATSVGVGADLIVPTLSGPLLPVTPGQVVSVTVTTRNQGTAATSVSTVTRFYWSTNSVYDAADVPLGERIVGPLGAGATDGPFTTTVTIPSTATTGIYYLLAQADADGAAAETSEINNTRSTSVGVGADLVVSAVSGPAAPVARGQVITVTETTRNQGTVATIVNTVTRFYWSTNSVYDAADVPLGERIVGLLAAGVSDGPVPTTITIPPAAAAGTYYLIALADANGATAEASETNNLRYTTVSVSP